MAGYRLVRAAEDQIDDILLKSAKAFGIEVAGRYSLMIRTALDAIGDDPGLLGSIETPRLPGIRAYPTRLSRMRVEPSRRIGAPRHTVIYRLGSDGISEVFGLVHDRMVLSREARRLVRNQKLPDVSLSQSAQSGGRRS